MNKLASIRDAIINDIDNAHKTKQGLMPLYNVSANSKIIIIGQAPGIKAEKSGLVWDDLSGDKLRSWLGVSRDEFYDNNIFGNMPMDFYYPGKGKSGDLPPRKEFAPLWHQQILNEVKDIKLIILIGKYAQDYYLKDKLNLTERVKNYFNYLPLYFPIVHPSPLNFRWHRNNPWFELEVVKKLQAIVREIINN